MHAGPQEFRDAASRFASGVTVVTVAFEGTKHGMTASSFASVSLEPPLILVSLEKSSTTRSMVLESGRYTVNVLADHQEQIAKEFAASGDKSFEHIPHHLDDAGTPVFDEALATFGCRTVTVTEAGDHDVLIAEVLTTSTGKGAPLLYFDRSYRRLD